MIFDIVISLVRYKSNPTDKGYDFCRPTLVRGDIAVDFSVCAAGRPALLDKSVFV